MDVRLNGLTLAYIGDAYYELQIRSHLIEKKLTNVNQLHKEAIKYTAGVNQAKIITYMIEHDIINADEISMFKTGRNSSGPGRKNIIAKDYHYATGFEALIGHLYLNNKNRADELIKHAILYIEKGDF
jgi:ribonuclease III family protein